MKKLLIISVVIMIYYGITYGMFEMRDTGARQVGMGGSGVAFAEDINSIFWNPAGLSFLNGINGVFNYSTKYSTLESDDSITYMNFAAGLPLKILAPGGIGGAYEQFGTDFYKESTIFLGLGMEVFYHVGVGINLKLMSLDIEEVGSDKAFGIDAGLRARVSSDISIGAAGFNINSPTMGQNSEEIPKRLVIGIEYMPLNAISFNLDIQKVIDRNINLMFGQEFRFSRYACVRAGVQTYPHRYSFGFGVHFKYGFIDYAMQTHPSLGSQHIISVRFNLAGMDTKPALGERRKIVRRRRPREREYVGPKVNINTADPDELAELPGIGPSLAEKIVKYRKENGPFRDIKDLLKVEGMSASLFNRIRKYITVGEVEEKPEKKALDLNTATMKDFTDIGLSPLSAMKIIKYRTERGGIHSVEELKEIEGLTPEDIKKIKKAVEGQ